MAAPFPHHYETSLVWKDGSRGILSAGPRPKIEGGPPPQFNGQETWWSPEHLLLASAELCFMTTFLSVVRKSKIEPLRYESRSEGVLEKTPEGLRITEITLHVTVSVPALDADKTRGLMDLAKKYCIISNSLKRPPILIATVEGVPAASVA